MDPERSLDPRTPTMWRVEGLLRLLTAGLPLSAAIGFGLGMFVHRGAGVAVGVALLCFQLFSALVWPSFSYGAWRYSLREHDLLVQRGVLFRRWSSIPLDRIQHVDTRQGPVERFFGLSRLLVYTAAGLSADGILPGLATAQAEALRDQLSRREGAPSGGDDGV
jgi:membrane protein YdbS with pleckstrin-like domain